MYKENTSGGIQNA